MAAGSLRHLLTLEQRTQVADATVGITTAYTPVAQVWGDVQATRGAVYVAGMQIGEGPTHRIVIRYRDRTTFDHVAELVLDAGTATTEDFDYLAGTYLAATERRWRVRDVRDPDGKRKWIEIMAEELKPEGGA
jgi:SPP1 family predicted phage head-tail adaptor